MARCKSTLSASIIITMLGYQFSLSKGSAESDANSVEIKLYPASFSDWSSSTEATFGSTVADQVTIYCGANPSTCGLDNGITFNPADVTVHSKSESSRSLKLSVYVSYPVGSNVTSGGSTTDQLPLAALTEILKTSRDSVKANIDIYITYIGSDYYGIPPESTANGIIIPIAAVTVVAVGITAVVMVYIQEDREKKERAAAKLARKRALKTLPNYNIQEVPHSSETSPTGMSDEASGEVHTEKHDCSQDSQAMNNNHKLKKRFENPTSISVNYFHSNGIISNTTNTLPSRSSTNNMTANTITIEETYNQQEQRQLHQQDSFEESQEEKKKRRKKEKKREKRLIQHHKKKQPLREQELEGLQFRENHDFETNAMTISENGVTSRNNHNIPTFTVHRREEIA